jgi:hypothetical protein
MPETLSQAQIEFYHENGFLVLENRITDIWLEKIRSEISRFEKEAALLSQSNDRLDLEDSHTPKAPASGALNCPI